MWLVYFQCSLLLPGSDCVDPQMKGLIHSYVFRCLYVYGGYCKPPFRHVRKIGALILLPLDIQDLLNQTYPIILEIWGLVIWNNNYFFHFTHMWQWAAADALRHVRNGRNPEKWKFKMEFKILWIEWTNWKFPIFWGIPYHQWWQ